MGDKLKRLVGILCLIALVLGLLPAGALAAGGGYGVSEFAFYYLYDSNLPVHPESPGKGPEFYGPSGNDVPFRMASVDIDELLELYPAGAADWESRKVISAVTCGLGMENNAEWWSGVVQCMDAGSREYFTSDSFGKLFQGYVLKGDLLGAYPNHLDGVIIVPPPLYLVELNDSYGGSFIATLSSAAPHTAQQVQGEIESYLKTAYGAQQIEWAGNYGVFRGAERTYSFSLRYEPGLGPDGGLNYEYKGEGYNLAMVTLYLTPHYTVRYDANGGAGYIPEDNATHESGGSVDVLFDHVPSRPGYEFLGWARNSAAAEAEFTAAGARSFSIYSDTTLYAVWRAGAPVLSIDKAVYLVDADGPRPLGAEEKVSVNDVLEYTVTVKNSGGPAAGAVVSDARLPADVTISGARGHMGAQGFVIDALAPGGEAVLTYRYTVTADDIGGSIDNTATVTLGEFSASDGVSVPTAEACTSIEKQAVIRTASELDAVWKGGAAPDYTPADADRLSVTVCPQADEVTLLYRVIVTAVNGSSALVTDPGAAYAGYSGEGFSVSENPDGSVTVTWAKAGTQAAPASAELYFTRTYTGLPGDRAGLELTNSAAVTVGSRTESAGAAVKVHTVSSLEKTVLSVLPEGVTLPEGVRPDEVTTTGGSAEVLLRAEQTGAVLLYELAVTGTPGAVFTVDDPGAVFIGGDGTGTIGPDGRAVLYCCREFARPAEGWSGVLENTASVFCLSSTASVSVKRLDGEIELTPADITIYMGGDKGYEAVVGGGNEPVESSSLPEPLFYVTLPGGGSADGLTLRGEGGRSWTLELAGGDAEGSPLYYIRPAPNQDPVRVQVTDDLGQVHISDSFDPGGLGGLSMQFRLDIYRGGAGAVTAELGGGIYTVRTKSGSLEVRYVVENMSGNPVYGVSAALSEPLPAGEAAVTAPAGTSYMLNDTAVPASGTGVGLLFDGLYDGSGSLEALRARVERIMGGAVRYEARYLDLVDADDGNAWVTASGPVTVHWGYPEGTDEHTSFTLLHFAGLHRSVQLLTDDVIANWPKVDNVPVRNTENGLSFEVTPGGFSPFVLVWEEGQSSVTPPVTPPVTTPVTPPAALNTKDHFAYMIGYEDGTIRPGNGITRAEAATIFFRLLTDEARGKYRSESSGYTDVAPGSWYNNAVSTLSRMGILSGYADGSFRPGAGITRAEFAKLAVSFFEYEGIKAENGFKDVAEGAWYARYVAAAAELGLVNGYEGDIFRPEAGITRAEASAIINRTLGRAPVGTGLLPEREMNTWPDNPADAWYYAHMQEATNSHAYRMSNGAEQWTRRLPEPDWDALQL